MKVVTNIIVQWNLCQTLLKIFSPRLIANYIDQHIDCQQLSISRAHNSFIIIPAIVVWSTKLCIDWRQ